MKSKRSQAKGEAPPKEEDTTIEIDRWDSSAVRNLLDDTARKVLTEDLGVTEDYRNVDIRLGLACAGCGAAGFALVFDYFIPYPASHAVLISCVTSYFVLMGILSLFYMFVQKNNFFFGSSVDTDKKTVHQWRLMSDLRRFSPDYMLSMAFRNGHTGSETVESLEKSVALYFDHYGIFNESLYSDDVRKLRDELVRANGKKQQ
ncbi:signal peptidase complex subunit 2-like [Sycon ciliatum]|uniref:signal peptidase complex subunit 2-like n=1 Tax=Sycon ciliatum TaxID=27933 RepID=UPI0020AD9F3E|eukprot:scpid89370/ scgid19017/ Probable signal peptidase complex subunit 2; Microsomal signal peptidase 25 kDa subunit